MMSACTWAVAVGEREYGGVRTLEIRRARYSRAEVMSPAADAMRLVDDEQADRPGQKVLEECPILEPLRCEVEHLPFTLGDLPVRFTRFGCGQMRVHRD